MVMMAAITGEGEFVDGLRLDHDLLMAPDGTAWNESTMLAKFPAGTVPHVGHFTEALGYDEGISAWYRYLVAGNPRLRAATRGLSPEDPTAQMFEEALGTDAGRAAWSHYEKENAR